MFRNLQEAENGGIQFADKLGVTSLEALRSVPAEDILAAAPGIGFLPVIDGYVVPNSLPDVFAARAQNDVPLLAGWNKDEGFNFDLLSRSDARPLREVMAEVFGGRLDEALAFYPVETPEQQVSSARLLGGDLVIAHRTWAWLEAAREGGVSDVFRYRFDHAPQTPDGWFGARSGSDAGAFHACELIYVFNNLDALPWDISERDIQVAKTTSDYWVNFIRTGNPNGPNLPDWPSYRHSGGRFLALRAQPQVHIDDDRRRQEFLASFEPSYVKLL
jgi:para-nitrobenzyl esterase